MLRMLSRVCAEFHDNAGAVLFTIHPADLYVFLDAPESIQQDPLFSMLVHDGSIELPNSKTEQKKLENDPQAKPAETESVAEEKTETADAAVTSERASTRKTSK